MNRKRVTVSAFRVIFLIFLSCAISIGVLHIQKNFYKNNCGSSSSMKTLYYSTIGILVFILVLSVIYAIRFMNQLIFRDALSGINNGAWIFSKGNRMFAAGKLKDCKVLFVNIKDCKVVNEKYGTEFGDEVITEYAVNIRDYVGKDGLVARIGGDNFVIVSPESRIDEIIKHVTCVYLNMIYRDEPKVMCIRSRCGIKTLENVQMFMDAVNKAGIAMAYARRNKTDYEYYTRKMVDIVVEERTVLSEFKGGLINDEFTAFYQPKIDIETGQLCGAEALVRWVKDGKVLVPSRFVPVLEKNDKIDELDFFIFEKVCKDIARWRSNRIYIAPVSINFSRMHINNSDFILRVLRIMEKYNVPKEMIEIELKEYLGNEDWDMLERFTKSIRENGIKIVIDNFGTGSFSLATLKGYNADMVKLDRNFLHTIITQGESGKVYINDIINMITNQGADVTCEGVETKEQVMFVRQTNCKVVQGFYFDRPLPEKEFVNRLLEPKYNLDI